MNYKVYIAVITCILNSCFGSDCPADSLPLVLFHRICPAAGDESFAPNGVALNGSSSQLVANASERPLVASQVTESPPPATPPSESLATFDEWKQKILSTENGSDQVNSVNKQPVVTINSGSKKTPLNFASVDCGARIVGSNSESTNVHSVLTENSDEYMNNPCSAPRKFFIVELCDSVSISEIEIGNFELFSSLPKLYNFSISDRYPAKEWIHLGKFLAREERQLSSFKVTEFIAANGIVKPLMYAKYVKCEILEHYGTEHYCPLTAIRVYGKGLLEEDDDDDDAEPEAAQPAPGSAVGSDNVATGEPTSPPTNTLFGAAKKTVMQLFQQVLPPRPALNDSAKVENVSISNASNKSTSVTMPHFDHFQDIFDPCSHCNTRISSASQCSASKLCFYYHLSTYRSASHDEKPQQQQKDKSPGSKVGPVENDQVPKNGSTSSVPSPTNVLVKTARGEEQDMIKQQKSSEESESAPQPPCENEASIDPANISSNAATIPTMPSSETAAKPLETDSAASAASSVTPEQIIVAGLFAPVTGLAGSEDEVGIDNNGELFPKGTVGKSASGNGGRLGGEIGKIERRNPSLSSAASSKQLLIRFVSRVRELEANLTLTNRFLQELSSNYRQRLDDMKLKVDTLTNITLTQAAEIERLSQQLNATTRFYENLVLSTSNSNIVYGAIPFVTLVVAVLCFFILAFTCITRHRPIPRQNSTNSFTQTVPIRRMSGYANGGASVANGFMPLDLEKLQPVDHHNFVASAPVSPSNGSIAGSSPSRQLSDSAESPMLESSLSSHTDGGKFLWPDSGISDRVNGTPLVVPSTLSTSFLLSPLESKAKNKTVANNKKKHHHQNRHNHNGDATAKSISPHRNSSEK